MPPKRKSTRQRKRTLKDIEPVYLDGDTNPAYSTTDSAIYLGISGQALRNVLKRHPEIKRRGRMISKAKYITVTDLERMKQFVEEE